MNKYIAYVTIEKKIICDGELIMISFGKWPRVFICERAGNGFMDVYKRKYKTFFSVDGKFDGFMYFTSYILVIGVWALVAVK